MSKLDDLIAELCPNGVEYSKFGDIANIVRGASPRPISKFITGDKNGVNWIKIGDVHPESKYITSTREKITKEGADKSRLVKPGDFVLSNSMSFGRPYIMKITGCIHDGWLSISDFEKTYISDFLYYLLSSNVVQKAMAQRASNGTVQNLNSGIVKSLKIPLSPLPIQCEIVRILENFTAHTAELIKEIAAELTARQKQYEYYRDKILTFGDEVKWNVLGELAEIGTGSSNTNEELKVGDYPFFVRSQDVRRKNTFEYDETAIITSGDGVGVGKIFHYIEGKYALHQRAYRIHIIDKSVNPKYYFYYMKNTFLKYIEKNAVNSSVTSIRRRMLDDFPVPVPSIEEQERIVAILERFDALANDITQCLCAEIESRQKQYEYYRDKLLTFKEIEK